MANRATFLQPLLIAALIAASASAHGLVIDNFTDGYVTLATNNANTGAEDLRSANVFGGRGRGTFVYPSYYDPNLVVSTLSVDANGFSVGEQPDATSKSSLLYGATRTANLGDPAGFFYYSPTAHFTLGDQREVDLLFASNDQPLTIQFRLATPTNTAKYLKTIPGGLASPFVVSFTSADLVSGTEIWTDFDVMRLDFFSSVGGTVRLTQVVTAPEPAPIVILCLGIAGAAIRRRRTRARE